MSIEVDKDGLVYVGPFPVGINNLQPEHALPEGSLANAVSVDIDNAGFVRRREGFEKVLSGVSTHSGWSGGKWVLFAEGSLLKSLNADDTVTTLCQVEGPVCAQELNGVVYFSDGVRSRKLLPDGSVVNWGVAVPPTPLLSASAGALPTGIYLVSITPIGSDGVEHGASEVVSISLQSAASIRVSLPSSYDPQIAYFRVYMSTTNGETLYAVADVAAGVLSYVVLAQGEGSELETLGVEPMPAGHAIAEHNGLLYVAVGNVVWHTDALAPDRVRSSTNYIMLSEDVNVLAATSVGVWIVTNKTYLYAGDSPDKFSVRTMAEYGAPRGNAIKVPNTKDVVWYSSRGVVRAGEGFNNLQAANVAAETGSMAAVAFREQDGLQQIIASVKNSVASPLVSKSFLEMEVIRKAG